LLIFSIALVAALSEFTFAAAISFISIQWWLTLLLPNSLYGFPSNLTPLLCMFLLFGTKRTTDQKSKTLIRNLLILLIFFLSFATYLVVGSWSQGNHLPLSPAILANQLMTILSWVILLFTCIGFHPAIRAKYFLIHRTALLLGLFILLSDHSIITNTLIFYGSAFSARESPINLYALVLFAVPIFSILLILSHHKQFSILLQISQARLLPTWIADQTDPYHSRLFILLVPTGIALISSFFPSWDIAHTYISLFIINLSITILSNVVRRGFSGIKPHVYLADLSSLMIIGILIFFRYEAFEVHLLLSIILVIILGFLLHRIHIFYIRTDRKFFENNTDSQYDITRIADIAIVPLGNLKNINVLVLRYACLLSPNVEVVYVDNNRTLHELFDFRSKAYSTILQSVKWINIGSEEKDLSSSVVEYIQKIEHETKYKGKIITVVIPEYIPVNLLLQPLYADSLRMKLRGKQNIILVDIRINI